MTLAVDERVDAPTRQPPRVLKMGKLTPDRIPVEIEGRRGPKLLAWLCGESRYPAEVAAALEDARDDYTEARERIWEEGDPPADILREVRALIEDHDAGRPIELITEHVANLKKSLAAFEATPRYKDRRVDWEAFLTRVLTLLIPGLSDEEAELIPRSVRVGWLWELGYFQPDEPEGGSTRPPEADSSSTGGEPEPDLVATTA